MGLVSLDFWCQLVRVWTCFVWVSGSALKCRPSQHACYTTCFNWRQGSKRFLWSVWSSKVKIKHANLKHGPYIFKQQIDLSQMRLPQLFETLFGGFWTKHRWWWEHMSSPWFMISHKEIQIDAVNTWYKHNNPYMAQHSPTLQFFCVLLGMVFHDLFNMYIYLANSNNSQKTGGFLLDSPDFSNILVQSMIPTPFTTPTRSDLVMRAFGRM